MTEVPAFNDPVEAARFAEYREAQIEEYGTYIAAEPIEVGNSLAFLPGHPVPKSTAEKFGWDAEGRVVPTGDGELTEEKVAAAKEQQLQARMDKLKAEREAIEAELASRKKSRPRAKASASTSDKGE